MARLTETECDACGALALVEQLRPVYEDSDAVKSAVLAGLEEDIYCPQCGLRTQVLSAELPRLI